ncbi:MAG: hypothetical protein ACO1NS_02035 [Daejeonella sp.]
MKFASFRGLKFKLYQTGRVEIEGSLHKYHNGGDHNYNDFTYPDLVTVLNDLEIKFGPEMLTCKVDNVEFGLNVITPFDPIDFTSRVIVYITKGVKLKQHITKDDCKGFRKGAKFILAQYQLKLYNKAQQYDQDTNILRCEYKTTKMNSIRDADIKRLSDLSDIKKLDYLYHTLMTSFNALLVREDVNEADLTRPEEKTVLQGSNPEFWQEINKFKRARQKEQYLSILSRKATTDFKSIVYSLLEEKYMNMIRGNKQSSAMALLIQKAASEAHARDKNLAGNRYLFTGMENEEPLLNYH